MKQGKAQGDGVVLGTVMAPQHAVSLDNHLIVGADALSIFKGSIEAVRKDIEKTIDELLKKGMKSEAQIFESPKASAFP